MSKTNIHIEWNGEGRAFTGHSPNDVTLSIDGGSKIGTSPMTMLLHAHAGCAAIDVLNILEKMRQKVTDLRVEVEAVRAEGDYPRVWEKIHLRFIIEGKIDPDKAIKAVDLSIEKYCSVSAMLEKTAAVSNEISLNGKLLEKSSA